MAAAPTLRREAPATLRQKAPGAVPAVRASVRLGRAQEQGAEVNTLNLLKAAAPDMPVVSAVPSPSVSLAPNTEQQTSKGTSESMKVSSKPAKRTPLARLYPSTTKPTNTTTKTTVLAEPAPAPAPVVAAKSTGRTPSTLSSVSTADPMARGLQRDLARAAATAAAKKQTTTTTTTTATAGDAAKSKGAAISSRSPSAAVATAPRSPAPARKADTGAAIGAKTGTKAATAASRATASPNPKAPSKSTPAASAQTKGKTAAAAASPTPKQATAASPIRAASPASSPRGTGKSTAAKAQSSPLRPSAATGSKAAVIRGKHESTTYEVLCAPRRGTPTPAPDATSNKINACSVTDDARLLASSPGSMLPDSDKALLLAAGNAAASARLSRTLTGTARISGLAEGATETLAATPSTVVTQDTTATQPRPPSSSPLIAREGPGSKSKRTTATSTTTVAATTTKGVAAKAWPSPRALRTQTKRTTATSLLSTVLSTPVARAVPAHSAVSRMAEDRLSSSAPETIEISLLSRAAAAATADNVSTISLAGSRAESPLSLCGASSYENIPGLPLSLSCPGSLDTCPPSRPSSLVLRTSAARMPAPASSSEPVNVTASTASSLFFPQARSALFPAHVTAASSPHIYEEVEFADTPTALSALMPALQALANAAPDSAPITITISSNRASIVSIPTPAAAAPTHVAAAAPTKELSNSASTIAAPAASSASALLASLPSLGSSRTARSLSPPPLPPARAASVSAPVSPVAARQALIAPTSNTLSPPNTTPPTRRLPATPASPATQRRALLSGPVQVSPQGQPRTRASVQPSTSLSSPRDRARPSDKRPATTTLAAPVPAGTASSLKSTAAGSKATVLAPVTAAAAAPTPALSVANADATKPRPLSMTRGVSLSTSALLTSSHSTAPIAVAGPLIKPAVPPRRPSHSDAFAAPATRASNGSDTSVCLPLCSDALKISMDEIQPTGRQLGAGCFGVVMEARMLSSRHAGQLVAVKTLKESAPEEEKAALEEEARVMLFLSADQHPHIVQLLGIATSPSGSLMLVEEFCALGNLLEYLRNGRALPPASNRELFSHWTRTSFAHQIAQGLAHLARRGVVHRDIAARNVLLTNQMVCKICDFGFARATMVEGIYHKTGAGRVPYKWMAMESLAFGRYSERSDVWAFGVTLWEIVTLGEKPYACVDNCDMLHHLQQGRRLLLPPGCPSGLSSLMTRCWAENPDNRPCFEEIVSLLEGIRAHAPAARATRRSQPSATNLSSKVSRFLGKILRRTEQASLDHATRGALLQQVSTGAITVDECHSILAAFERGLLAGPRCEPGEEYATCLVQRHRDLRLPKDNTACDTDFTDTVVIDVDDACRGFADLDDEAASTRSKSGEIARPHTLVSHLSTDEELDRGGSQC